MDPPPVTHAPLSISTSFYYSQLSPAQTSLRSAIPLLGQGWHFFWRASASGVLEIGVAGGVVKSNWETMRLEIKVSTYSGRMIFDETTNAASFVGQVWPGYTYETASYRGHTIVSTLEVKLSSAELSPPPARLGVGYASESIAHTSSS